VDGIEVVGLGAEATDGFSVVDRRGVELDVCSDIDATSLTLFNVPVAATSCNILLVIGVAGSPSFTSASSVSSAFFVVRFASFVALVALAVGIVLRLTLAFAAPFAGVFFSFATATALSTDSPSPSAPAPVGPIDAFLVLAFFTSFMLAGATPSSTSATTFLGLPRPRFGAAVSLAVVVAVDADMVERTVGC
jgi:hypothetical protein